MKFSFANNSVNRIGKSQILVSSRHSSTEQHDNEKDSLFLWVSKVSNKKVALNRRRISFFSERNLSISDLSVISDLDPRFWISSCGNRWRTNGLCRDSVSRKIEVAKKSRLMSSLENFGFQLVASTWSLHQLGTLQRESRHLVRWIYNGRINYLTAIICRNWSHWSTHKDIWSGRHSRCKDSWWNLWTLYVFILCLTARRAEQESDKLCYREKSIADACFLFSCQLDARDYINKLPVKAKQDYNQLFGVKRDPATNKIISGVSPDGIRLLDRLLSFDHRIRPTAAQALGKTISKFIDH